MIIAAIIATLVGGGVYLILQRGMLRLVIGLTLLSHAVNLLILTTGVSAWREEPFADHAHTAEVADPVPQAFVLTAIVISMASTAVLLTLTALGRDDDTRSASDPDQAFKALRSLQTMGLGLHRPGNDSVLSKLGANKHHKIHRTHEGRPQASQELPVGDPHEQTTQEQTDKGQQL